MDPHQVWKSDPDLHQIEKPEQGCGFAQSKAGYGSVSKLKAVDARNGATEAHPGVVEAHIWSREGSQRSLGKLGGPSG
jgi:hypothetical protein